MVARVTAEEASLWPTGSYLVRLHGDPDLPLISLIPLLQTGFCVVSLQLPQAYFLVRAYAAEVLTPCSELRDSLPWPNTRNL